MAWTKNDDGSFSRVIGDVPYRVSMWSVFEGREMWTGAIWRQSPGDRAPRFDDMSIRADTPQAAMERVEEIVEHRRELSMLARPIARPSRRPETPWGQSDQVTTYAPGIVFHSTPSHGGFEVSPDRLAQMPEIFQLRNQGRSAWYEEDCHWAYVALSFPALFTNYEQKQAERTVRETYPDQYEAWSGRTLAPGESFAKDQREFYERHADDWVGVSAGSAPDKGGMIAVTAIRGGRMAPDYQDAERRTFLVPVEDYRAKHRRGFVVDPAHYDEVGGQAHLVTRLDLTAAMLAHHDRMDGKLKIDCNGQNLVHAMETAYVRSRPPGSAPLYLFLGGDRYQVSDKAPPAGERYYVFRQGLISEHVDKAGLTIKAAAVPHDEGVERMTQARARELLSELGLTLRVNDGEFRVNFPRAREELAYYTNDLDDAVNTGRQMADHAIRYPESISSAPAPQMAPRPRKRA